MVAFKAAYPCLAVRVLLFMPHPGYARNLESTLRLLNDRGHAVHVGLDRDGKRGDLRVGDMLDSLLAELAGLSASVVPRRAKASWSDVGTRLRGGLDYLRYLESPYVDTPKPRDRAGQRVPDRARAVLERDRLNGRRAVRAAFSLAERHAPISTEVLDYIESRRPDVVSVTPLVELGSPQTEYVRAAHALGVPVAHIIASWDNLTMKGGVHSAPDRVIVWNDAQRREAIELHGVPAGRVRVTGAYAYDYWNDMPAATQRTKFLNAVGLDPRRPYVFYAGSSRFIAPDEIGWILDWHRGVTETGRLPNLQVLVRPHPGNNLDENRDAARGLSELPDVAISPAKGENPTTVESRQHYIDSLVHSSAVVGINTSAFLEATLARRPTHTLLTPRYADTQGGTLHFRHLAAETGPLQTATTFDEHARQLSRSLRDPSGAGAAAEAFCAAFLAAPEGGAAGEQVAVELEETAELKVSLARVNPVSHAAGTGLARGAKAAIALRHRRAQAAKRKRDQMSDETRPVVETAPAVLGRDAAGIGDARGADAAAAPAKRIEIAASERARPRDVAEAKRPSAGDLDRDGKPDSGHLRRKSREAEERDEAKAIPAETPLAVQAAGKRKGAKRPREMRNFEPEIERARVALSKIARADGTVLAGPFLSEVGFELLYWIPFLRWAFAEYPELAGRTVVVSRGGVGAWLQGIDCNYADVFGYMTPQELVARRESLKQREPTALDREILDRVASERGLDRTVVLHPGLLFNQYYRVLKIQRHGYAQSVQRRDDGEADGLTARYRSLRVEPDRLGFLPEEYFAVRFYFRPSFADTPQNRDIASRVVQALAARLPVVLLNNRIEIDDHSDFEPDGESIIAIHEHMTPETNLAVQTQVLAGATTFVGTYGGLAYLAPSLGLPSISFTADPQHVHPWHQDLAMRIFAGDDWGSLLSLQTGDLPMLELLSGIGTAAQAARDAEA